MMSWLAGPYSARNAAVPISGLTTHKTPGNLGYRRGNRSGCGAWGGRSKNEADKCPAGPDPGLGEHGLQVVLDGVHRDVQVPGDLSGDMPPSTHSATAISRSVRP